MYIYIYIPSSLITYAKSNGHKITAYYIILIITIQSRALIVDIRMLIMQWISRFSIMNNSLYAQVQELTNIIIILHIVSYLQQQMNSRFPHVEGYMYLV